MPQHVPAGVAPPLKAKGLPSFTAATMARTCLLCLGVALRLSLHGGHHAPHPAHDLRHVTLKVVRVVGLERLDDLGPRGNRGQQPRVSGAVGRHVSICRWGAAAVAQNRER